MKRKKRDKNIEELIPGFAIDEALDCFQNRDTTYMNIYQINSKDLVSSDVDDIEMDCFKWAKFHKMYYSDLQILTMKYPCNTQIQQEHWKKRIENNRNPVFEPMLKTSLNELIYQEKHTTSREFYLQVFWEDKDAVIDGVQTLNSVLEISRYGLIRKISMDKRIKVLFKLNNKNSMIF